MTIGAAALIVVAGAAAAGAQQRPSVETGPPAPNHEVLFATIPRASVSAVAMDPVGNTYVVGSTSSPDVPTTADALKRGCEQVFPNQCYLDAVVVKLDGAGRIVWATRLGGSDNDAGDGLAVDAAGNVYVAGTTWSEDFPVKGALAATRPAQQGFLTTLSPSGALLFSTSVPAEGLTSVAVDETGAVAVAGFAYFESSPLVHPQQARIFYGPDVFVAKLAGNPPRYVFSTYLGGASVDAAESVALSVGRVYIAGYTGSSDFPVVRARQSIVGGGGADVFAAALSADGQVLEYSTVVGGARRDQARAIAVDKDGTAYVTGNMWSGDFPTTVGALAASCGSDGACNPRNSCGPRGCSIGYSMDALVVKFGRTGELLASTYVGGAGDDYGFGILVDAAGHIEIAGVAASSDLIGLTPLDGCESLERCTAFVAEVSAPLDALSGFRSSVPASSGAAVNTFVTFTKSSTGQRAVVVNNEFGAVILRVDSKP